MWPLQSRSIVNKFACEFHYLLYILIICLHSRNLTRETGFAGIFDIPNFRYFELFCRSLATSWYRESTVLYIIQWSTFQTFIARSKSHSVRSNTVWRFLTSYIGLFLLKVHFIDCLFCVGNEFAEIAWFRINEALPAIFLYGRDAVENLSNACIAHWKYQTHRSRCPENTCKIKRGGKNRNQ